MRVNGKIGKEKEKVDENLKVGTCKYGNKDKYKGQWHNDKKEGTGISFSEI